MAKLLTLLNTLLTTDIQYLCIFHERRTIGEKRYNLLLEKQMFFVEIHTFSKIC